MSSSGRISKSGEVEERSLYCLYKPSVSPWIRRISTQDTSPKIHRRLWCLPRVEKLEGSTRAFISSHTGRLIPRAEPARACINSDSSQTRSKFDLLAIFFFSQPFISNLAKGKTRGNKTEGDRKRLEKEGGNGYYNKKNRSRYSEVGKNNFNIGKGFLATGPTLVLKGWLGLREVEDWEIKLDVEESQVEEVDRLFRDHATHILFCSIICLIFEHYNIILHSSTISVFQSLQSE